MTAIFTIGHSNHPIERFVDLLTRHDIKSLADIRRFPGSPSLPHFNRERLQSTLAEAGISYHWLEKLGGRRGKSAAVDDSPNLGLRNASFRNFADYMLTEEFHEGLEELLALARQQTTAMMCAEGLWWRCHRRLVSDYLAADGVSVRQIFPNGTVKPHTITADARVTAGRVTYPPSPSLFDDGEEHA